MHLYSQRIDLNAPHWLEANVSLINQEALVTNAVFLLVNSGMKMPMKIWQLTLCSACLMERDILYWLLGLICISYAHFGCNNFIYFSYWFKCVCFRHLLSHFCFSLYYKFSFVLFYFVDIYLMSFDFICCISTFYLISPLDFRLSFPPYFCFPI